MNSLNMQPTPYTPGVKLDADNGFFEFEGISLPENVLEFYTPIISWLKDYSAWLDDQKDADQMELKCVFKLEYYNSGSVRFLISVLQNVKIMNDKVNKVTVEWFYEKDDIHIFENGKELEELIKLKFIFIETQ
ncbi:MAG: DUF1987 domain-containing protein [Bacteroidales bacterium]|nr:DUF1987 domain-containing protein [Bacteroidales bacterium]